ncbi:MAG: hypothetical protein L0Z62_05620 [Gemmataceae bacterium]|nr:hypothetical protein [Gemmataceae bacterium]
MPASTRSPLAVASTFLGLFVGGAVVGVGLAGLLAPGSWWAEAVSGFALPVAFALGLQAWFGLALLSLVPRLLGLVRQGGARRPADGPPTSIPGAVAFVPIASGIGALVGVVIGWLSASHPVWLVAPIYWLVGTLYGLLAWALARAGFLMPPEST